MIYKRFVIENFKGIGNVTFDLSKGKGSSVYTLVGLNESGKTTILQAIAFFYEKLMVSNDTFSKYDNSLHTSDIVDMHSLIPKEKEYGFDGITRINATVELEKDDLEALNTLFGEEKFRVTKSYNQVFEIELKIQFSDSKIIQAQPKIEISLNPTGVYGKRTSEVKFLSAPTSRPKLLKLIGKRIPAIIYYPNFLLDFPKSIQLEKSENEEPNQRFYRRFLQDVLDSFDGGLTLEKSIIAKARSANRQDQKALQQILRKMESHIQSIVFREDFKMLSNTNKNRSISISQPYDSPSSHIEEGQKTFYPLLLDITLEDGVNSFSISERSLGFGWLFAFLLFTQFRLSRKLASKPVFVFDEPASNLHSTYQMNLLTAIEEIVKNDKAIVIYSTHSHYMINPKWLGAAYIVRNNAINYESLDPLVRPATDIKIETYRSFAVNHPEQRTYFQPILDVLEFRPSNIELLKKAVIVEGKSDYYYFEFFRRAQLNHQDIATMPGTGSSNMKLLISLYIGWAKSFVIVLDDDKEGKSQKISYIEEFGEVVKDKIFTLSDINHIWSGWEVEDLLSLDAKNTIVRAADGNLSKISKKSLSNAIEFCLITNTELNFDAITFQNFSEIFAFIEERIFEQEQPLIV